MTAGNWSSVDPAPAVWFSVDAIREHYAGPPASWPDADRRRAEAVAAMSDAEVRRVGVRAYWSEAVWRAFDEAVGAAVDEIAGEVMPAE